MLTSIRQSDKDKVYAKDVDKSDAPFECPVCRGETVLRKGAVKIHHFAHKPPVFCEYGKGESEAHRNCKQSIFEALKVAPDVTECELEKNFGRVVSDVFFVLSGRKVAIEVQISNLTMNRIIERTEAYNDLGIYVLWMPLFDSKLNKATYAPKLWEKWLHATYFGRVYYWLEGLSVMPIHFSDHLLWVEATEYGGGYDRKSKRYRTPKRGSILNILNDFEFRSRSDWKGGSIYVPHCKLLVDNRDAWWKRPNNSGAAD